MAERRRRRRVRLDDSETQEGNDLINSSGEESETVLDQDNDLDEESDYASAEEDESKSQPGAADEGASVPNMMGASGATQQTQAEELTKDDQSGAEEPKSEQDIGPDLGMAAISGNQKTSDRPDGETSGAEVTGLEPSVEQPSIEKTLSNSSNEHQNIEERLDCTPTIEKYEVEVQEKESRPESQDDTATSHTSSAKQDNDNEQIKQNTLPETKEENYDQLDPEKENQLATERGEEKSEQLMAESDDISGPTMDFSKEHEDVSEKCPDVSKKREDISRQNEDPFGQTEEEIFEDTNKDVDLVMTEVRKPRDTLEQDEVNTSLEEGEIREDEGQGLKDEAKAEDVIILNEEDYEDEEDEEEFVEARGRRRGQLEDEGEDDQAEEAEEDIEEEEGAEQDRRSDIPDEERRSGDGEEAPQELDDDQDRKNPAFVPRTGPYYMHDSRTNDADEKEEKKEKQNEKKLWQNEDRWRHDRYIEQDQAPKSSQELRDIYGFDIRTKKLEDAPLPARGRGRGRGRGRSPHERVGRGRGRGYGRRDEEGGYRGQEIREERRPRRSPYSQRQEPPSKENLRNEEEWPTLQQQENIHVTKQEIQQQTTNTSWAEETERQETQDRRANSYRGGRRQRQDDYESVETDTYQDTRRHRQPSESEQSEVYVDRRRRHGSESEQSEMYMDDYGHSRDNYQTRRSHSYREEQRVGYESRGTKSHQGVQGQRRNDYQDSDYGRDKEVDYQRRDRRQDNQRRQRGNRRGQGDSYDNQRREKAYDSYREESEYERQWGFKSQQSDQRDKGRERGQRRQQSAEQRAHEAYLERQNQRNSRYGRGSTYKGFNRADYERTGKRGDSQESERSQGFEQNQGYERRQQYSGQYGDDSNRSDGYDDQDSSRGNKRQWVNRTYQTETSPSEQSQSSRGRYGRREAERNDRIGTRRNERTDTRSDSQDQTSRNYQKQVIQTGPEHAFNLEDDSEWPQAGNGDSRRRALKQWPEAEVEAEQPPRPRESKAYSKDRRQRLAHQGSTEEQEVSVQKSAPVEEEEVEGLRNLVNELKVTIRQETDPRIAEYPDHDVQSKIESRPIIEPVGYEVPVEGPEPDQRQERLDRRDVQRGRPKRYSSQRQRGGPENPTMHHQEGDQRQRDRGHEYQTTQGRAEYLDQTPPPHPPPMTSPPHPVHAAQVRGGEHSVLAGSPEAQMQTQPSAQTQTRMVPPPPHSLPQGMMIQHGQEVGIHPAMRPPAAGLPSAAFFNQPPPQMAQPPPPNQLPPPQFMGAPVMFVGHHYPVVGSHQVPPLPNYSMPPPNVPPPPRGQHTQRPAPQAPLPPHSRAQPQPRPPPPSHQPPPPRPEDAPMSPSGIQGAAPLPGGPPLPGAQMVGGITYYSPEMQQTMKRPLPAKRQANPLPIEAPPDQGRRMKGDSNS